MLIQLIEKVFEDWELFRFWIRFWWILDWFAEQCFMYPQSKERNQFFPKTAMNFWEKLEIHVTLELFTDKWKRTGVFVIFTSVSVGFTLFPPSRLEQISSKHGVAMALKHFKFQFVDIFCVQWGLCCHRVSD